MRFRTLLPRFFGWTDVRGMYATRYNLSNTLYLAGVALGTTWAIAIVRRSPKEKE